MVCWWFIRKTPTHGFDCVWVRSILAAVSFTVRRVVVYDLLVSWASSVGHAGLAFDLADLAASMVQPFLISGDSQLSYWVVNHLVVLWLIVRPFCRSDFRAGASAMPPQPP
jgi:hypothetical protein